MAADITTFDCTDLGPNNVVLTVTDNAGNSDECTSVVTVHYEVAPVPVVTPQTDIICSGEETTLILSNNIPVTTWTWTVISSSEISGASDDQTGTLSAIRQILTNSERNAHAITYTITPTLYGACALAPVTADVWVNPVPEIHSSSADSVVCDGEGTTISLRNPNISIRGQWVYDLAVVHEAGVTGTVAGGTYTSTADLEETLVNTNTHRAKAVYYFTPRIIPEDGGADCTGPTDTLTIWVHPRITWTSELSNYNGFNISCHGLSDGSIEINPNPELAPYTIAWRGPNNFTGIRRVISHLAAGQYTASITDSNGCHTSATFNLTEPERLSMIIEPSVSNDGNYNINCYNGKTGTIDITPVNNVGNVEYRWSDGIIGDMRRNLSDGTYNVIITDANNCHADSSVTLTQPERITLAFDVTNAYCPDKPDGEIRLDVTG
ncbi:MAG: hypothetical protein IH593_14340, partial [Bacteroidales bacterium]|nr:hypothetical protein [Bacteroidales bacterium]